MVGAPVGVKTHDPCLTSDCARLAFEAQHFLMGKLMG